jgi:hypothetical protein
MGFIVGAEIHFTAPTEPILHRTHVDQGNIKAASLFILCQPAIAGKKELSHPRHQEASQLTKPWRGNFQTSVGIGRVARRCSES